MYELVARNPGHFSTNDFGEYKTEVWGKKDGGYVYFVKSVFDREMGYAGFNSAAFLAWASRQGILDANEGRRTKRARISGSVLNTVCIQEDWNGDVFTDESVNDEDLPY